MDVVLIRKNIEKGNHSHLSRSILVPVAFVSMLIVTSVVASGDGNNQMVSDQTSPSKDNLEALAWRINALPIQATRNQTLPSRDNLKALAWRIDALQVQTTTDGNNQAGSENQTSPSMDNLEELAWRINALPVQATAKNHTLPSRGNLEALALRIDALPVQATTGNNNQAGSENQTSSSMDNLERLALRINVLPIQTNRLKKQHQQLQGNQIKVSEIDFSISWDDIIMTQPHPTQNDQNLKWHFSNHLQPFSHQASVTDIKHSIKTVSENFLQEYRSHTQNLPYGWPLKKGRVSSGFGPRGRRIHKGIDIAAEKGAPIFAVESGTVVYSKYMRGYGRVVEVKHSSMYSTRYAHNSKNLVEVEDEVIEGQIIALVGSTGRSTGPHLHFEVRQSGVAINPIKYLGALDSFTLLENIKLSDNIKLLKK